VKQGVMQQLDRHFAAQPDVVFCSNTINFNIDALSATMAHHRERVVGVRFLAPVYYIPRIEVSPGRDFTGTRAFLSVWHALVRLGFAPFLFHFAPGAPRVKLGSEDVDRLLSSTHAPHTPPHTHAPHAHTTHTHGLTEHTQVTSLRSRTRRKDSRNRSVATRPAVRSSTTGCTASSSRTARSP
jgi:hypothetical protein